jgi:hypothetical protein
MSCPRDKDIAAQVQQVVGVLAFLSLMRLLDGPARGVRIAERGSRLGVLDVQIRP